MKLADLLSDMIAGGADIQSVQAVVEAARRQEDAKEQRRRELTAARVAKHRAARNAGNALQPLRPLQPSPPPALPPEPPNPPTPAPVVIPPEPSAPAPEGAAGKRGRKPKAEPEGFAEWYGAYPEKVGRTAAAEAYRRVIDSGRATRAELIDGLERYKRSKPPDRAWCHPTTFLNQGRWADQPAEPSLPLLDGQGQRFPSVFEGGSARPASGARSAMAGIIAVANYRDSRR